MNSSNNKQVGNSTPGSPDNVSTSLSMAKEPDVENQDAWFALPEFGLMAISDGATNGSTLTSVWSNLLAQSFCNSSQQKPCEFIRDTLCVKPPAYRHADWLQPLQDQWQQKYQQMQQRVQNKSSNAWNPSAAPQAKRNAKGAATFLGVHLLPTDSQGKGKWQAIAVGDSCVFQFRKINGKYELLKAFPIEQSTDFSSKPSGFTSRKDMALIGNIKFIEEEYELGDTFFLATDALAEWLLKNREYGKDDWQKLLEIEDQVEFNRTIKDLRDRTEIAFDDTTFTRMQVVTSPKDRQPVINATQLSNSQAVTTSNSSTGIGVISLPSIQPYQTQQSTHSQQAQLSPLQSQNNSNIPQTIISTPPSSGTFGGNNLTSTVVGPNTVTGFANGSTGAHNSSLGTRVIKPTSQSTPFWKNKKFLQAAAIVGATVAAVGVIAYAIHQGHHDLPGALQAKGWHDAISADIAPDGTLTKASWEHLTNASPQELQALAKQNPALAQRLESAITNHLDGQSRAGELLDIEKFKALRESGGFALKDFIPADEQATLKFINKTFEQHGLEGNFKSFADAQEYISSQAKTSYEGIDAVLAQQSGTTYQQFDQVEKSLSGNAVYEQIKQQWETHRQELQKAKDVLSNAITSGGSSILQEAKREGGTLNASADMIYLELQQGFNWAAAASIGMTVGKMAARGIISHALPVVGAALTTYSVSKRTYDHLMTKADKLGILAEREGSTIKERLQYAPVDLARVVNQAVTDAPQDFRDMCATLCVKPLAYHFHKTSKYILSALTSRFGRGSEEERSQMQFLASLPKSAYR
ncbi:MAG: hypothetical protein KME49_22665 [Brasilonema octagenarum HA4186-MV1]|jgi:hypothetical protein|nr:hypothetical protein [Brasilonema octagenarum HA4186-MV1]